jgi:hypothetical protein
LDHLLGARDVLKGRQTMTKKTKEQFIDAGNAESERYEPNEEVQNEFDEAARLGSGQGGLIEGSGEQVSTPPTLSGNELDAAWEDSDMGDESVGGANPAPDQNIAGELGKAMGLSYEDNEPLHSTEKVEARDHHRWELDPASSEGFDERMKREGEYEEK